jgi:hypothetical protein
MTIHLHVSFAQIEEVVCAFEVAAIVIADYTERSTAAARYSRKALSLMRKVATHNDEIRAGCVTWRACSACLRSLNTSWTLRDCEAAKVGGDFGKLKREGKLDAPRGAEG